MRTKVLSRILTVYYPGYFRKYLLPSPEQAEMAAREIKGKFDEAEIQEILNKYNASYANYRRRRWR